MFGTIHYVNWATTGPTAPYSTWATSAASIQDAINACNDGDIVSVTNGIYTVGVNINKAILVRSANGPSYTIIDSSSGTCAHLVNHATLSGFTLIGNGNAGAQCDGYLAVVTNCVIMKCGGFNGAGVSGGTIISTTLLDNTAWRGGGAFGSFLINCLLFGNACSGDIGTLGPNGAGGGGAYGSTLVGCTLLQNRCGAAYAGCSLRGCVLMRNTNGAAVFSTLTQCTVVSNDVGVAGCVVYNSILHRNATNSSNFTIGYSGELRSSNSFLNYSCSTPLATGSGNISTDPQLAGGFHMTPGSPCRGMGSYNYATDADIDNKPWLNPPSMGCSEAVATSTSQGPVIVMQPTNQTRLTNTPLTLTVQASGAMPLTYTWLKGGAVIPGAGGFTPWFTIMNAQAVDSGAYQVLVTNLYGGQLSAAALVSIGSLGVGDALNSPELAWSTGGTAGQYGWTVEGANTHDGIAALQSGMPPPGAESWVQTSVTGPGTLSFWWGFNANNNCWLEFYVDGVKVATIGQNGGNGPGYTGWYHQTNAISSGSHSLYWRFFNLPGYVGYYGYLDQVQFRPPGNTLVKLDGPEVSAHNVVLSYDSLQNVSYVLQAVTNLPPLLSWNSIRTNAGTGGKVSLTLTNVLLTNPKSYYRLKVN